MKNLSVFLLSVGLFLNVGTVHAEYCDSPWWRIVSRLLANSCSTPVVFAHGCLNGFGSDCPNQKSLILCGMSGNLPERMLDCIEKNGMAAGILQVHHHFQMRSACPVGRLADGLNPQDFDYYVLTHYDGVSKSWVRVDSFPFSRVMGEEFTHAIADGSNTAVELNLFNSPQQCWVLDGPWGVKHCEL